MMPLRTLIVPRSSTSGRAARRVVPVDPVLIVAAGHAADPALVREIPLDGFPQAARERLARLPAELRGDLRAVDRVTPIVAGPVLHESDQRPVVPAGPEL